MVRVNPLQGAFNAGEFGPRLAARVDFAKYQNAGARVENMIPLPQGGLTRRPGTRYVAPVADHAKRSRLLPFEFSTEQAYVLEACDGCFRFLRNKGQLIVQPTDAAITNGTFDADIAGWNDLSEGAASITPGLSEPAEVNTLQFATVTNLQWGQTNSPARACFGVQFVVPEDAEIIDASVVTGSHSSGSVPFTVVAGIYADSAGSVGAQVGSNSGEITVPGGSTTKTFTFATPPVVTSGQTYWIVMESTSAGRCGMLGCASQAGIAGGWGATPGAISVGSGNYSGSYDLRIKIQMQTITTNGTLNLNSVASDVAAAEQAVSTTDTDQEHVVAFEVLGVPGDTIKVRAGSTTGGDQYLADFEAAVGRHVVAFTPDASPFYLGFRNASGKTVYVDNVSLLASGESTEVPLEIVTPYLEAELQALKWSQSADVMYFAHPNHAPRKLSRFANSSWSLTPVAFDDGPYLDQNLDATKTLQPSATTGNGITITAAGHEPFKPGDVGRPIRLHTSGEPGWAVITEIVGPEEVIADVKRDFAATTATENWMLGSWSVERGYPSVVTFFEQRTAWANTTAQPQSFWMSQSADLENMRPDSFEGGSIEVQDDDGLDFTIAADEVNAIRWLSPGRQLILGTSGGEWSVTSDGPVVTPDDVGVKRESTNGSANTQPLRIGSIVLFLQRAKRKLREFAFSLENDGFRTPDLTILADHITKSGIREIAYQQEADSLVFCVREDGGLPILTYRREEDVVGWSRHILGGTFEAGPAAVESVATIPGSATAATEGSDEAWIVVKRTIDGSTRRYIEVFEEPFEGPNSDEYESDDDFDAAVLAAQKRAFYVDSGLTYEGAPSIILTGLDHLEGETVKVWGDGAVLSDRIVSGGQVTLATPVSKAVVGLSYRHVFRSLKLAVGAKAGTAVGKVKRVHGNTLVLLHSLGVRIGPNLDSLMDVPLREVSDAMDTAVPLFTGEVFAQFDGDYERDARIVIAGDAPAPLHLLAIAPEMKTNEQV